MMSVGTFFFFFTERHKNSKRESAEILRENQNMGVGVGQGETESDKIGGEQ